MDHSFVKLLSKGMRGLHNNELEFDDHNGNNYNLN